VATAQRSYVFPATKVGGIITTVITTIFVQKEAKENIDDNSTNVSKLSVVGHNDGQEN
jgi:hypothetical protein